MSLPDYILIAAFGAFAAWQLSRVWRAWRAYRRIKWLSRMADRELMLAKKYLATGNEPKACAHACEAHRLHGEWEKTIQKLK